MKTKNNEIKTLEVIRLNTENKEEENKTSIIFNEVERINITNDSNHSHIQIISVDNKTGKTEYHYITLWGKWNSETNKFEAIEIKKR